VAEVKTVLIVDDDEDFRVSYREALSVAGYSTAGAADGEEALALLRQRADIGLILLDLMMPRMNGWELYEKLARDPALARIPLVVVTAGETKLPGVEHLSKVADLGELLAVVRRHLR
jgi:CheY-like chemotaxis protein